MTRLTRFTVAIVVAGGGSFAARSAGAVDCSTLQNPIYVMGSAAFQTGLKTFAVKLVTESSPTTVVSQAPGSCLGVEAISSGTLLTGTATYFNATGTAQTCNLPIVGQAADLGISDVFYESCPGLTPSTRPSTVGDFRGPVVATEIVVPQANTSQYITAQEAQDIWGCGATAGIAPFDVAGQIFCRDANQGAQIILADGIELESGAFMGTNAISDSGMVTDVGSSGSPQNAIGFIEADVYDANRATLNALAFEAFGQTLAFYADSSSGTTDRQNVRDGHYPLWGYEHLFATVDGTNKPTNPNAARLIGLITGTTSDPRIDYVQMEGAAGLIPLCAMTVQKTDDTPGYLSRFDNSADPCSCAYLLATGGTVPASCVTCSATGADGGTGCTGGKSCHHGFCE